nr:CmcI family methyltransferase [Mesorhizobium sp.]
MNRSFKSFFDKAQLESYQSGVMNYSYKGVPCLKSPIDIAIYMSLIFNTGCRTIIEIGSKHGGSAIMLRDFGRILSHSEVRVVSIDVSPPSIQEEGIGFFRGDVRDLRVTFDRHGLWALPRPWLVVEDSSHIAADVMSAMVFFAEHLKPQEWLVVEDGILAELGIEDRYNGGPNRAIESFQRAYPSIFKVGEGYCDMFGYNATYNPNGFLCRSEVAWSAKG